MSRAFEDVALRRRAGSTLADPTRPQVAPPRDRVLLSAAFVKEGDGMPTTGTLSLFINDQKVGEDRIMTQPGNSLVGEGLNVGMDPGEPVTADYAGRTRSRSPAHHQKGDR